MAEAVATAIDVGRHLVVQAGTGTGKSLGYLVPSLLSGRRVVVATATKALQDQLATKDLPFLAEHLGRRFEWAVLKGRSSYLCLQRVRETSAAADGTLALEDVAPTVRADMAKLARWSGEAVTGDEAELTWAPHPKAWEQLSVTSMECPGATRCPLGDPCFAETARRRAAAADVVVVNTHLYGLHLATGGMLLPEHDVVVLDEAHQLEDVISQTAGMEVTAGRLTSLARVVGGVLAEGEAVAGLAAAGNAINAALAPFRDRRVDTALPDPIAEAIAGARRRIDAVLQALRAIDTTVTEADQRKVRAMQAATALIGDLDAATDVPAGYVAWVEGPPHAPSLQVRPIDVAPVLKEALWDKRTAVLTSATIPAGLAARVGLPAERTDELDVGSPFDYEHHALLYCATHLPNPRQRTDDRALHDELRILIEAAGGRTLALFTSWKAMQAAADALRPVLAFPILIQSDLPKPALVAAFAEHPETCLFATAGLFQGVDIPGATLSLVTIDRIPFPRPDDPLLDARRDRAGADAFRVVDLPRAATMLAQAAGRLIRSSTDRGVVAVLDPRLASANYRWDLVRALPPMKRTKDRTEVEAFLRSITETL